MYDIDWRYAMVLDPGAFSLAPTDPGEQVDLVFEGIDTIGTVRLRDGEDEVELGRTYNMHRSYRFDLSPHLVRPAARPRGRPGVRHGVRRGRGAPARRPCPGRLAGRRTTSFARWPAASAGTGDPTCAPRDCGSRCGWSGGGWPGWTGCARWSRSMPPGPAGSSSASTAAARSEAPLTLAAEVLGRRAEARWRAGASVATLVSTSRAPVWWPVGYGEQPLADLTLTLSAAGGSSIGGSDGSVSGPCDWTPPRTTSAPRSPSRSMAARCSPKGSTGSPTTTS